jgi:hypothetical protein
LGLIELGQDLILSLYYRLGLIFYFTEQAKINLSFNLVGWAEMHFLFLYELGSVFNFYFFLLTGRPLIPSLYFFVNLLGHGIHIEISLKVDRGSRCALVSSQSLPYTDVARSLFRSTQGLQDSYPYFKNHVARSL